MSSFFFYVNIKEKNKEIRVVNDVSNKKDE